MAESPHPTGALLSRLAEVEAEIELEVSRHKSLMDRLEIEKIEVLTRINALRDPLSRIPLEITSTIFDMCLPEDSDELGIPPGSLGLVLLRVSRGWAKFALATSSLWTELVVRRITDGLGHGISRWIGYARGRPASLTLVVSHGLLGTDDVNVLANLVDHLRDPISQSSSINTVRIGGRLPGSVMRDIVLSLRATLDSLTLFCADSEREMGTVFELLQSCASRLRSLCLVDGQCEETDHPAIKSPLVFSCLFKLELRSQAQWPNSILLNHIEAPALTKLTLVEFDRSLDDMRDFVRRSNAPITSLRVVHDRDDEEWKWNRILPLLPQLQELDVSKGDTVVTRRLIDILTNEADVVPALHTLSMFQMQTVFMTVSQSVDLIDARQASLRSIKFDFPLGATVNWELERDALAALKKFIENGLLSLRSDQWLG
ncbi:unnamed protein product [Mycena citricolor]|uniref:F-box domain-containing protein n=1 Tax=Mycena citricolor TaxID=2018698 RepID=A0AAD2H2J7_9AGAR|nr:unnamed protein product [Mycena citricolor]